MRSTVDGSTVGSLLLLCVGLIIVVTGAPIPSPKPVDPEDPKRPVPPPVKALKFMQQFGYLEKGEADSEALFSEDAITEAIRTMQKFGAIEQTGILDNATLQLLETPRCGVPDVIRQEGQRRKRFVIGSEGWNKRHITYFLANWSPKLGGQAETQQEVKKAFDVWSGYSRLTFQQTTNPNADIIMAFGRGWHGDSYAFDGPGNILAHAYFPYEFGHYGGDVHFDDDENWMLHPKDEYEGVDFFTVATHELGHSLGLSHSPVSASVMFPYYKGYNPNFVLDYDDILAMYELYILRQLEDDKYESTTTADDDEGSFGDDDQSEGSDEEAEDPDRGNEDEQSGGKKENDDPQSGSDSDDVLWDADKQGNDDASDDDAEGGESAGDAAVNDEPESEAEDKDKDEGTEVGYEGDYETVDEHKDHDDKHGVPGRDDLDGDISREDYPQPPLEDPEVTPDAQSPEVPPELPPNHPKKASLCDGSFDALSVLRGELFIFKGEFMWRLPERGVVEVAYPVPLRQMFWKFPDSVQHIDAVYQRQTDGNIIFFTGNQYWVSDGDHFTENSPHSLTDLGLPSGLAKVDAAHIWGKNGKTYFFSKNLYWRYNETAGMDQGYPQDISRWRGVPQDLDASFRWTDGNTYFFKDKRYWRFNDQYIKTDDQYPQPAAQYWVGCPEETDRSW